MYFLTLFSRQLLDFAIYREWHNGYVKSITPHAPTKAPEQGDKLDCVMEGFKFTSVVVVRLQPSANTQLPRLTYNRN